MVCGLCNRENELTRHHLVPRCLHSNKWYKKRYTKEELSKGIKICKNDCHPEIHKLITEKEMGKYYHTISRLLKHNKVKKYLKWKKQRLT